MHPDELAEIRAAVREHYGDGVTVRLFGSRLDDGARGGDIDLFIDDFSGDADDALRRKLALLLSLKERLGDQRIDVVVARRSGPVLPVHRVARRDGALL